MAVAIQGVHEQGLATGRIPLLQCGHESPVGLVSVEMIDLLYLAWNRLEFTRASIAALLANTNWSMVRTLWLYDDGSTDGTLELLKTVKIVDPVTLETVCPVELEQTNLRSPVATMNHFMDRVKPELFAKIDSDVIVPPYWLEECVQVLERNPKVDMLGIEAMYPPLLRGERECVSTDHVGGIGLIRGRAFEGQRVPRPNGRFGFTMWQRRHLEVVKVWLQPSLPVILLDKLPMEPWWSLSAQYVANGWQRVWYAYTEADQPLWDWWNPALNAI